MQNSLIASREALQLVANACFENETERKLFLDESHAQDIQGAPDLRHIDRGYQQDVLSALKIVADWTLGVAASVPEDMVKDAIKLWIYAEAHKRINNAQFPESARAIFERLKAYLEKQIK